MERRKFIENASLAGFAFTAIGTLVSGNSRASINKEKGGRIADNDFTLNEITIDELQQKWPAVKFPPKLLLNYTLIE